MCAQQRMSLAVALGASSRTAECNPWQLRAPRKGARGTNARRPWWSAFRAGSATAVSFAAAARRMRQVMRKLTGEKFLGGAFGVLSKALDVPAHGYTEACRDGIFNLRLAWFSWL